MTAMTGEVSIAAFLSVLETLRIPSEYFLDILIELFKPTLLFSNKERWWHVARPGSGCISRVGARGVLSSRSGLAHVWCGVRIEFFFVSSLFPSVLSFSTPLSKIHTVSGGEKIATRLLA